MKKKETMTDYYEILGVSKDATQDEIKSAFRKRARELHPDVNKAPDAEEKFKELGKAYDTLSDDNKRATYDRYGEDGLKNAGFDTNGPFASGFGDLNDIFESFFGGFGGFGGSSRGRQQHRGSDLRLKVRLSLEEIAHGVTKKFKVRKDVTCSHCHGSGAEAGSTSEQCPTCHGSGVITHTTQSIFGMMQTQGVCPTCNGEGTIIKNKCKHCGGTGVEKGEEVVEIKIPAGVAEGMVVNIPGKGNAGQRKGINGDIQVFIEEEENETFIRDDNDLIYNLLLDFPTAALGGEVEIPTIEGTKLKVKMEPGTQPGKTLRLRGKGLPAVQGYGRGNGDLVVNVSVFIPKTLSREEKTAIEEFKKSDNFKGDAATKRSIFQKFKNYFS
jgi:molecular chaperone DnaJ